MVIIAMNGEIKGQENVEEINPNVANLYRGKTCQGAPDVASHSLGEVEAYLTGREILPETSKGADGVAWCESSGFGRQQVCHVRVY